MLSLLEFEKLTSLSEEVKKQVKQKEFFSYNTFDKVSSKEFFTTYRNRRTIFIISEYLNNVDNFALLFLNRFTFTNLKRMFNETAYMDLKKKLVSLKNQGYSIRQLLTNSCLVLRRELNYEKLLETKKDTFVVLNLLGKWLNQYFFRNKIKNIVEGKESEVATETVYIDFSNCDLGLHGLNQLFFMIAHNTTLEEIDISGNAAHVETFKYIKFALKKPKALKRLNLERNNIATDEGMKYFVEIFPNIQQLTFLNLCRVGLTAKTVTILSENLHILKQLETFYIDGNYIETSGATILLDSLKDFKKLTYLSMNSIGLNGDIAKPLENFFSECHFLSSFSLNQNEIGDTFFKTLANMKLEIRANILEFENCSIKDEGLKFLLKGLQKNPHVITLNLSTNIFSYNTIEFIQNFIEQNKTVKKLSFRGNKDFNFVQIEKTNKKGLKEIEIKSFKTEIAKLKGKYKRGMIET